MFCFQCEQTAKGTGCTVQGVCGKDSDTAALQDLLVFQAKQIGAWAHRARQLDAKEPAVDRFIVQALFSTVTNVNFDPARLQALLAESAGIKTQGTKTQLKFRYVVTAHHGGAQTEQAITNTERCLYQGGPGG